MKITRLSILGLLVLLLLTAGCTSTRPNPLRATSYPAGGTPGTRPPTTPVLPFNPAGVQTPLVTDLVGLLDRLRASGASVGQPATLANSPFSAPGFDVLVNGAQVQVFEYPSSDAALADAMRISPDGATFGGTVLNWPATPHVFYKGRLLIVYPGAETAVLNPLEFVLGRQVAGAGQIEVLARPTPTTVAASKPATATVAPARGTGTPSARPACTDKAVWITDVTVPDGSIIPAGQSFLKTWRVRNTGTCTWTPDYALVYASGPTMDGQPAVPISTTVKPGGTVDVSTRLTAPAAAGTYRTQYQLRSASGKTFGIDNSGDHTFWVEIVVRPRSRVTVTPASMGAPVAALPTQAPRPAAGKSQRVILPPGATSAALTFNLAPGATQDYVIAGQAGELIRLYLGARGSTFTVTGPGGLALPPTSLSNDGRVGEFALLSSGDYTITVQGAGNTLTIEMPRG